MRNWHRQKARSGHLSFLRVKRVSYQCTGFQSITRLVQMIHESFAISSQWHARELAKRDQQKKLKRPQIALPEHRNWTRSDQRFTITFNGRVVASYRNDSTATWTYSEGDVHSTSTNW